MLASHIRKNSFKLISAILLLALSSTSQANSPRILVSIKPLHSIISHITDGVTQTELLLDKQQSPHHFHLRPSQQRMLNQADIFFYSSPQLEGFVESLKHNTDRLQFVELSSVDSIRSLPARGFHTHEEHTANEHKSRDRDSTRNIDGHIWLSIENAKIIAQYTASLLSRKDPENTSRYQANLQALLNKLDTLKKNNFKLLSTINQQAFLVYHDAYQYFELENNLTNAHFVTINPEHTPGIKRIKELKRLINEENIHCIFYEPPNIPSLLTTLSENSEIHLMAMDPAGSQLAAGKQHYFTLMQQTASILHTCLSNP